MLRLCLLIVVVVAGMATSHQDVYRRSHDTGNRGYTKHRPGRRVCTNSPAVTRQEPTIVSYSQSSYKPITERCQDNQMCMGMRLVYETAYKTVYQTRTTRQAGFSCCPGWSQVAKVNHGCNQATCRLPCQNGGTCTRPDVCSCPPGFTGSLCQTDVDECERDKPCDQLCHNTAGSYRCECRHGFTLLGDEVSCRSHGDTATEARDLQGDFEILHGRIAKLEKMMEHSTKQTSTSQLRDGGFSLADLSKKMDNSVAVITRRLAQLERHQENQERHMKKSRCSDELAPLRSKLLSLERRFEGCHCKHSYNNGIFS